VVFLLILPGAVIAIASNMTGIQLFQEEGPPPPEYEVVDWRRGTEFLSLWVRMPPDTTDNEMKRVVQDIVRERYKGRPYIRVYFFLNPSPSTGEHKRPFKDGADATFRWRMRDGIAKLFP